MTKVPSGAKHNIPTYILCLLDMCISTVYTLTYIQTFPQEHVTSVALECVFYI